MRLWGACLFVVAILMLMPLQPAVSTGHNDFTTDGIKKYLEQIDDKETISLNDILKELMEWKKSLQDIDRNLTLIYTSLFILGLLEGWLLVGLVYKGIYQRHPLLFAVALGLAPTPISFYLGSYSAEHNYNESVILLSLVTALCVWYAGFLIGGYIHSLFLKPIAYPL